MIEFPQFKRGEEKFLRKFEEIHKERPPVLSKEEAKEKVKRTIEEIKKEIESLPEIKKEAEIHHISVPQITNTLAQALELALDEDPAKGLEFIYQRGNPFLIDAFHDILVGYYLDLLQRKGKLKIEQ